MFARAGELGLHRVAHAGEEGPPAYIASALDVLQVERIDHGVRCLEDPALVQRLARRAHAADRVPAVERQAVRVPATWPSTTSPTLLDAGLCATVNSDDPAYFGGYINDNFVAAFAALPQLDARARLRAGGQQLRGQLRRRRRRSAPGATRLDAVFARG